MSLTQPQQIHKRIDDANNILITFRKDGTGDAVGSAIALLLYLESFGKRAEIIVENFILPKQLRFLKHAKKIKSSFSHLQKFTISLDIKGSGVENLTYDVKDGKLRIHITPKSGSLSKHQVKTAQSDFKYDLIITTDTQDMDQLGEMYHANTELFFKIPIINIDRHTDNEHFGEINVVDVSSSSTAEIVYCLLKDLGDEYISESVATALLTGMIWNTRSFKTDNIRPRTLALASKLIAMGGRRDYIVRNLYQTRTIASLKLWGKALANLQSNKETGLVWTTLTRETFVQSGAEENDLYEIVDELIGNSPEAQMTLLIHEHIDGNTIHAILTAEKGNNAMKLLSPFQPRGDSRRSSCEIHGKSLHEAEQHIIEHIKKNVA